MIRQISNRSEWRASDDPVSRAALLLSHPMRRWIVERALRVGEVTGRDVELEWPGIAEPVARNNMRALAQAQWLVPVPGHRRGTSNYVRYAPGDVQALRELHTYLTELLALSPNEVTHEADE